MKKVEYNVKYFSTGQAITLECNCKVSFWNGPAATNTEHETSTVEITDIYGDPKVLNITIYMHGGKVVKRLPETLFKRINVIGDNFDLHITNLSTSDEGLYICDCNMPSTYLLQTKLLPSKLKIVNATHESTLNGKENCQLNLVCLVERGKPPAVIKWKNNGILISQGESSKLVYTFTPNKSDDQSVYTCEAQNEDMKRPLTKSIQLNIKYNPFHITNVSSTLNVVEGETAHMCCTSMSNPEPTFIFWHKDDQDLVSAYNNSSLCYTMINVSRNDTGSYVCSSQNEIGDASSEISLVISYPPVINIRYRNLTEYSHNREIRCLAKGEPDTYNSFTWEHQSLFDEHIRYLDGTDDGILRLPEVNISNIYQDTGFYLCNVSNGIPDYGGNLFQLGRAYYLVSIGRPVFAAANERIQVNNIERPVEIKVKVYSSSTIICHNITEVGSQSVKLQYIKVRTNHVLLKEKFHDAIVTVNGIEVLFVLNGLNVHGSRKFNVTVCNRNGQSSCIVESFVKSSDENALTFQEIINIVLFIIILVLITGIGVYIRYTKHRYRQRVITEINIQTAERNVDASPHYADILEDSILTLRQETDGIVPGNSNTTAFSDNYSSSSSNTDNIASDDLNDGYEKPYTTLISNTADEVEHVYRKAKQTLTYENSTAFTNATFRHSVELQRFSFDIIKTNGNSNEDRANTDMHYEENDPQEIDDVSNRSNSFKRKETVEYINLSLKH